ncbi:MAG: TonB-dependent receptor [Lacunisphaera sp.]
MNECKRFSRISTALRRVFCLVVISSWLTTSFAQTTAKGSLEGRVYDDSLDLYLPNAKVSADKPEQSVLTDALGYFRINNLEAGPHTVSVFYTGKQSVEKVVNIMPAEATKEDFTFRSDDKGKVTLETFVVAAKRETDGLAIAMNEQRFSPNIKSVLDTSQAGEVPDANVAELAKLIPGVTITGGRIQLRGLPPASTEITTDGNPVASAVQSGETRAVQLDHLILNNVSRIEFTKVPTPDMSASSIGGKLNLVSKSAFERTRPELTYRAFYSWTNEDALTFGKTPGPISPTTKLRPGLDLSWIVPINSRFGFSATYTHMSQSQPQGLATLEWVPNSGLTAAQKQTTADAPYVKQYNTRDSARTTTRDSVGLTFDFRLSSKDIITFGGWYTVRELIGDFHDLRFVTGDPVIGFGPTYVNGPVGKGSVANVWTQNSTKGHTLQPSVSYRHMGSDWKADAAISYSRATDRIPGIDETGTFNGGSATIANATINLADIGKGYATATATTAAGTPIDYYNLSNYRLSNVTDNPRIAFDEIINGRASIQKDLSFTLPVSLRAGADIRRNVRDIDKPGARSWNYVGPDHIANSGDESASIVLDESFSTKTPIKGAYTGPIQYPGASAAYALYVAHPDYFALSSTTAPWVNEVNASKRITETISAAYVRADVNAFHNRLWIIGGIRFEKTEDDGYGPLINPKLAPAGVTDPVQKIHLTNVKRGTHLVTSYQDYFPSMSAKFDVTPDLILRAGYAETITRPDFSNILPGITVPDPSSTSRTITLANPNLKPWRARNYDVSLDYYFKSLGTLSAGVYRKDITDFFGQTSFPSDPALLDLYGLDPSVYGAENGYVMSTRTNAGDARISGVEVSYRQALNFQSLPQVLRGIEIFGGLTCNRLEGAAEANFSQFSKKTYTIGLNYRAKRYNLSLNMVSQGTKRMGLFTGAGAPPLTYDYQVDPQTYNASGDLMLTSHVRLFFSVLNIGARAPYQNRSNASTPDYAKFRNLGDSLYSLYTFGIKGSF